MLRFAKKKGFDVDSSRKNLRNWISEQVAGLHLQTDEVGFDNLEIQRVFGREIWFN